jgi:hypothetical protein
MDTTTDTIATPPLLTDRAECPSDESVRSVRRSALTEHLVLLSGDQVRPALHLSRLRPLVVLSAFLLHATGCYSWVTASVPTPGVALNKNPPVVRILRVRPSSVVTLTNPAIVGDTLTGFSGKSVGRVRVAVPLSEVAVFQTKQFSLARTVGLTLLLAPVVLGSLALYGLSTLEP